MSLILYVIPTSLSPIRIYDNQQLLNIELFKSCWALSYTYLGSYIVQPYHANSRDDMLLGLHLIYSWDQNWWKIFCWGTLVEAFYWSYFDTMTIEGSTPAMTPVMFLEFHGICNLIGRKFFSSIILLMFQNLVWFWVYYSPIFV